MPPNVPDFDDLPKVPGKPQGNTWGLWGKDDQLGTLNLLTPDVVLAAKDEIKSGKSFSLDQPLDYLNFRVADRQEFKQEILDFRDNPIDLYKLWGHDDVIHLNTQSSSQWDGLRHIALQETHEYYNGLKHEDVRGHKDGRNGIHKWVENGSIVGRGILLDYVRWRAETGQPPAKAYESTAITVEELEAIAAHQGTTFKTGDILLIRSGFSAWYDSASEKDREEVLLRGTFIGVEANEKSVRWLWNHHFAALAGDTVGWEVCPVPFNDPGTLKLHEWILAHWGTPLGELWQLEKLAEACAQEKRWSFFFTSAPLYVKGGVGSPPNAIAVL